MKPGAPASANFDSTPPVSRATLNYWLVGWKVSNLVFDVERQRVMFFRMAWDGIITGPDSACEQQAECYQKPWHSAPAHGCRCGFNAFSDRPQALIYYAAHPRSCGWCAESVVVLRVGLKGRAIEGTYTTSDLHWGYRAQSQQVTDVFVPRTCYECDEKVVGFMLDPCGGKNPNVFAGMNFAKPSCTAHGGESYITLEHMRESAQKDAVTIRWSDE